MRQRSTDRFLSRASNASGNCLIHKRGRCGPPRRRERTGVISVAPDTSTATERAVDDACDADGKTAYPARERPAGIGLRYEMHVIVLDCEVNDPEILARGNGQRAAHVRENMCSAQAADRLHGAQRDVDGPSGDVRRAPTMRNAGAPPRRDFPSGAGTSTTPRARGGQRKLNGTPTHTALIRRYYQAPPLPTGHRRTVPGRRRPRRVRSDGDPVAEAATLL